MQIFFTTLLFLLLFFFSSKAQNGYVVFKDSATGQKIYQGIISEEILRAEKDFGWMHKSSENYSFDTTTIQLLQKHQDSLHLLLFLGTWCEDSQQIVPKLFKLLHKTNLPHTHISILGVDRHKKTLGNLSEAFNISRVPTIIILKKGEEQSRIIEYGRYGNIERDLSEALIAF